MLHDPHLLLLHLQLGSVIKVLQGAAATAPVVLTRRRDLMRGRRHRAELRGQCVSCEQTSRGFGCTLLHSCTDRQITLSLVKQY